MDRQIVYPGSIPLDTDILNTNRNAMIALGYLAESVFGSATFVSGLVCSATAPTADLNIHVGRGIIGQLATIDGTAYGALLADTADPLFKVGINTVATTFPITPPTTSGYSQNYLVECQLQEIDGSPVVLPYYNAANPSVPYSGPANDGLAQNTVRNQRAQLQVKAGVPAAAGTQVTPGTDNGWVPLYVVSVNYGQTQITSASITRALGAPFIGALLSQTRTKLMGNLSLYVSPAPAGNDAANSGLSANVPFATLQAAANAVANNYDLNGFGVNIQATAGTYAPVSFGGLPVGYGTGSYVTINGSGVVISSSGYVAGITASGGATVSTQNGVTLAGAIGLQAYSGGSISVGAGTIFGACSVAHMIANGGAISLVGSYSITGGAPVHYQAISLGGLGDTSSPITVSISGTPSIGIFAQSNDARINVTNVVTYSGTTTGERYLAQMNGVIDTGGAGASFFPGTTAGSTITGGQYA